MERVSTVATARHDFAALTGKNINIIFLLKFTKLALPMFSLNSRFWICMYIDG